MPSVLFLGASRGVAFYTYKTLAELRPDLDFVLVLRNPDVFKKSEEYKSLSQKTIDRTLFIKGDATDSDSLKKALNELTSPLDTLVTSIGGVPVTGLAEIPKILYRGFSINPPNLCTQGITATIPLFQEIYESITSPDGKKPRLVAVTSQGIGAKAHKFLPWYLKIVFSFIKLPHSDKAAMELSLKQCLTSIPEDSLFPEESDISKGSPCKVEIKNQKKFLDPNNLAIIRPSLLTNGELKGKYRVGQEGTIRNAGWISRRDAGSFVGRMIAGVDGEDKWWGHQVVVAY